MNVPKQGSPALNEAQLAAVLNARLVLASAPPPVALTFAVSAFRLLADIKTAEGAPPLPPIIAAIRDSAAETLGTLVKIPPEELDPPEEWADRAGWFCDAVARFSPDAPSSASAFAEQILAALSGGHVNDPELKRVQRDTSERVKAIASHVLATFDKSLRGRIMANPELRRSFNLPPK